MNRQSLPICEIQVIDRQRKDLGDLQALSKSLTRFGLIQPIVLDQNKRLIAGGRRLAAATSLGWTSIDVVYRETLSEEELLELEYEENWQRKDQTWQEQVLHIDNIHRRRISSNALQGFSWLQEQTGALLGCSTNTVNWNLQVAKRLRAELASDGTPIPTARFWKCDSAYSAWQLILKEREDDLLAANAKEAQVYTANAVAEADKATIEEVARVEAVPDLLDEARQKYEANPLNIIPFEQYWEEKKQIVKEANETVYLSSILHQGDSIDYMLQHNNAAYFDHIITDIPYGIDMSMLSQGNTGMDVSSVEAAHDVAYNTKLIAQFYHAAWQCTKDNAFVVTWADAMLFNWMHDCAKAEGFAVQRWPLIWRKPHAMNQRAECNFTKNYEIAIVCRKPGATLVGPQASSIIEASGSDDITTAIKHPFAKPFAVWEFIINAVSLPGQRILEPFAGGGSGVVSLLRLKRKVIAVELEAHHYNELLVNVKELYYKPLNPNFIYK